MTNRRRHPDFLRLNDTLQAYAAQARSALENGDARFEVFAAALRERIVEGSRGWAGANVLIWAILGETLNLCYPVSAAP
jgi:hypothetical protein